MGCDALAIIDGYAAGVAEGKIPANRLVQLACNRHRRDRLNPELVFDAEIVENWLAFMRKLPHVVGEAAERGETFEPLPWQVFCIGSILGWHWSDGRRRYRLGLIEVARGNGKTTLLAGVALWAQLHGSGREVYLFANTQRQAKKCYRTSMFMARGIAPEELPHARGEKRLWRDREFTLTTDTMADQENRNVLMAIPAKENSLDGLDPFCFVADETSEYESRALQKLTTATVKRQDAFGVMITTPGSSDQTIYYDYRREGVAVLEGDAEAEGTFYFLSGIDASDEPADTEHWIKANPSLGHTVQLQDLRERYQSDLAKGPRYVQDFRRFHLCTFVGDAASWIPVDQWDACESTTVDLTGSRAVVGVDLSKSRDLSAVVALIERADGEVQVEGWYLYPEDNATERERELRMPLLKWGLEGHVHLCPGRTIDYALVHQKIRGLCDRYRVSRIYYDPYMTGFGEREMEMEGLPIMGLPQRITELSPGVLKVEDLVASHQIHHDGDPVLRQAVQNAKAWQDTNLNARLCKKRSEGLIDPAVALTIAARAWVDEQIEGSGACPIV